MSENPPPSDGGYELQPPEPSGPRGFGGPVPGPPPQPSAPPTFPGPIGGVSDGARVLPPYSFGAAMNMSFQLFKEQWGKLVVASLIVIGTSMVVSIVQNIVQAIEPISGFVIGIVLSVVLTLPMTACVVQFASKLAQGRTRTDFSEIFTPLKTRYGRLLGASALYYVIVVGTVVVAILPVIGAAFVPSLLQGGGMTMAGGPSVAVWVVVALVAVPLFIGAYYIMARLALAPVLVIDSELGSFSATDSLRASWKLTQGKGWSLLGLMFVLGLLSGLSVLLLCVGVFLVGYPLLLAGMGGAYAMLTQPLRNPDICATCGYDMKHSPGICPECGTKRADRPTDRPPDQGGPEKMAGFSPIHPV